VLLEQARGREERALEGDALHAQLQIRVGGLLAGDAEGVDEEHANLPLDDQRPVAGGDARPTARPPCPRRTA
jgi:hypothetical protein